MAEGRRRDDQIQGRNGYVKYGHSLTGTHTLVRSGILAVLAPPRCPKRDFVNESGGKQASYRRVCMYLAGHDSHIGMTSSL